MKQLKDIIINFLSSSPGKEKLDKKGVPVTTCLNTADDKKMIQYGNVAFSNCTRVDYEEEPDYGVKNPVVSQKRIPFSNNDGLVERVRFATKPLTEGGEFTLKSVSYRDHWREDGGSILLTSRKTDIRFHFNFRPGSAISCSFKLPSVDMPLFAENLFTAKKIPVRFDKCDPLHSLSGSDCKDNFPNTSKIIQYLNKSGTIEEIHRLCTQMAEYMPEIHASFSPENLDETIRLYTQDYCSKNKWATRHHLPKRTDSGTSCQNN